MGSSYTKFHGKGFWSNDSLLQGWLRVMSLHIPGGVSPCWRNELRERWLSVFGTGAVLPSLDEFLTDHERVDIILEVSERSIESLRAFGAFVPAPVLNLIGVGGLVEADLPIEWFERIADTFDRLLRGELATDNSTGSPTLPATRIGQRWDELEQPRKA